MKILDENVQFIAIFLIGARDPRQEFLDRAGHLVSKGKIEREDIPELLDKVCKVKGNAGEVAREVREQLKREGWKP